MLLLPPPRCARLRPETQARCAASPTHLVRDEDGRLVAEDALDAVLKDVLRGVVVDGAQRVVQQHLGK